MGKDKLSKFAAIKEYPHVFEHNEDETLALKGNWRKDFFKNDNPIVLELGCGKGEYSVGLAKHFPNKNFIGCDIKGNRIYIGAKDSLEQGMTNVAFLRTRIDYITDYFSEGEIDEIWLTFSDPQPKKPRKRLSSPLFIDRYRLIIKKGGIVHMKTDSNLLFEYTEEEIKEKYELIESTWDLYGDITADLDPLTREIFHIKTHYEQLFTSRGSVIKYCKFKIG
jgi:tRNA (guanine-N7-)-methyltransferase